MLSKYLQEKCGINSDVYRLAKLAESQCSAEFDKIDEIRAVNQLKVIKAMQKHNVSDSMFAGTTGYGYDDRGRDTLDKVYADVFNCEAALVRSQIVSGTQALALCLYGILRPGMTLVAVTGAPYDTLEEVIGIRGNGTGSLKDFGVKYVQVDLLEDGSPDYEAIKNAVAGLEGLVCMQRSRGYAWRNAFSVKTIGDICSTIREVNNDIPIMVDNCYGEFVDVIEPTEVGADIIAGSLIKNPGGGIAPTGGYVAGKKKYVDLAACRLTCPGLGAHVGSSLNINRLLYQGIFLAPHVVAESIKGAVFTGQVMSNLGFMVSPGVSEERSDIIQAIKFENEELLIAFCQGIQAGSPVDSFVVPEPWDMPGYEHPVIMAAGAFVQGSSIELSADAPMKEPYIAYMQGGLVYDHVRFGVMIALQKMHEKGLISL